MPSGSCFIKQGYTCPFLVLYVLIISFVKTDLFLQGMHAETDNVRKGAKQKYVKSKGIWIYRHTKSILCTVVTEYVCLPVILGNILCHIIYRASAEVRSRCLKNATKPWFWAKSFNLGD
jgi:hypothetical protein